MKKYAWVAVWHLVGVVVVLVAAFWLNDTLKDGKYSGAMTCVSGAFAVYCFVANLLYHTNQKVFLFVNQTLNLVRRTHTYWLPAFDFTLNDSSLERRRSTFGDIEAALKESACKVHRQAHDDTPTSAAIVVDDTFYLTLRLDESHLHVTLDRKILVPSHLYEQRSRQLSRIAEDIERCVRPESARLGIAITFDDGVKNPYFGFFVQRIPSHLFRHFEATFMLDSKSTCRIEAGTDRISIESQSKVDLFNALSQVLALKVSPAEATT